MTGLPNPTINVKTSREVPGLHTINTSTYCHSNRQPRADSNDDSLRLRVATDPKKPWIRPRHWAYDLRGLYFEKPRDDSRTQGTRSTRIRPGLTF